MPQGADLSESQSAERGQQHCGAELGCDRVGDLEDLLDRRNRALCRALRRGSLHHARIAHHDAVLNSSGQHCMDQSVALGDRRGARLAGRDHVGAPRADAARRDLTEARSRRAPGGCAAATRPRTARECAAAVRSLGEPARRVLLERHLAGVGVDPRAAVDVGAHRSEVRVGLALGAKRRRRAVPDEIDAVARLEPTRRQLAHASPRAATHGDDHNSLWHGSGTKWHDDRFREARSEGAPTLSWSFSGAGDGNRTRVLSLGS